MLQCTLWFFIVTSEAKFTEFKLFFTVAYPRQIKKILGIHNQTMVVYGQDANNQYLRYDPTATPAITFISQSLLERSDSAFIVKEDTFTRASLEDAPADTVFVADSKNYKGWY